MKPSETSVTGVLVTGKTPDRYPLAKRAVAAWLEQRYEGPRNLIILNDHPTTPLYTNKLDVPPGVTELRVSGRRSLGELRNMGINHAKHDYIVQWDDDDFSHPNRLTYQVLKTEPGHASIFKWEINCNLIDGHAFANNGNSIRCKGFPGTMLWPRETPARFPHKGKAEDTEFVLLLKKRGIAVDILNNDPWMYFRCYHGFNTWSEKHVMKPKPGSRDLNAEEKSYVAELLSTQYKDIVEDLRVKADAAQSGGQG